MHPTSSLEPQASSRPLGLIDLQVNGYAGVDFNRDGLTAEALHGVCERLRADGVACILATIITDEPSRMCRRLRRIAELRAADPLAKQVVAGLHVEGPFLNESPGYIGAHPAHAARAADPDTAERLLDAACGLAKIVTLAPERDPGLKVTRLLADRGVTVSAGHTDASLDQLRAALDAGLTMFTHLGNGCPMTLHRHDNIIQRVLSLADRLTVSFIADGAHVPWPALGNYLRLVPPERVVIVSDAISAAGLGPGRYTLGDQSIVIADDLVPRAPGGSHFIGSACPLPRMADNLRTHLGIPDAQVRQWITENPLRIVGPHQDL